MLLLFAIPVVKEHFIFRKAFANNGIDAAVSSPDLDNFLFEVNGSFAWIKVEGISPFIIIWITSRADC